MPPDEVFEKLLRRVTSTVQGYRSDLDLDREWIADNPGVPFIHVARKDGTHIHSMPPQGMTHLRAATTYVQITVFSEPGRVFTYFDGENLYPISKDAALRIWWDYHETHAGLRQKAQTPHPQGGCYV